MHTICEKCEHIFNKNLDEWLSYNKLFSNLHVLILIIKKNYFLIILSNQDINRLWVTACEKKLRKKKHIKEG